LDALVEDGDGFRLNPFFSYACRDSVFGIAAEVRNPGRIPDLDKWTEEQREHYRQNSHISFPYGEWTEQKVCYNTETNLVEEFDPDSFWPEPTTFFLCDHAEDYRRLNHMVQELKPKGYEITEITFGDGERANLVLRTSNYFNDPEGYYFWTAQDAPEPMSESVKQFISLFISNKG
jgi:hypothetical protein